MSYEKLTVAVADPDIEALKEVRAAFERIAPDNRLILSDTPAELEDYLRDIRVDMLITETRMPGLDGFELSARLLERQPWAKLIFLSAFPEDAVPAMRAHADDFLVKPLTDAKLLHALLPR